MRAPRPGGFTIVIPTRDRPRQLQALLTSLAHLEPPAAGFSVIVVDDGSVPPVTLPPADTFEVQLIRQTNQGPAAARNTGARAAQGTYLAFLDDDCQPDPDWLLAFERVMAADAGPLLLGGHTRNAATANAAAEFNQQLCDAVVEVAAQRGGFFPSNNVCVPRAAFETLAGFRAVFRTAGGEDRDFSLRWHAAGWQHRSVPDARVQHHHPQTLQQFWRMHERYGRGARQVASIHGRDAAASLNPITLAGRTLRRTGPRGAPLYLLSQVATALGYLRQMVSR